MSIRIVLNYWTRYRFDKPVQLHPHVARLRPPPHCLTPICAYSLAVELKEHFVNCQQDPFSNYAARFVFPEKT